MRLGPIQKDILAYLNECGGKGAIWSGTQSKHFSGRNIEEVESALQRLIDRKIVKRLGHMYEIIIYDGN